MKRVDGKTALVTGSSRGIGRAIALELVREGAKVAINYSSSAAKAKELAEEISYGDKKGFYMYAGPEPPAPKRRQARARRRRMRPTSRFAI